MRKLQYIAELERSVQALQAEGCEVSAELEFLNQQSLILGMENKALKQRLDNLAQEQLIKRCKFPYASASSLSFDTTRGGKMGGSGQLWVMVKAGNSFVWIQTGQVSGLGQLVYISCLFIHINFSNDYKNDKT